MLSANVKGLRSKPKVNGMDAMYAAEKTLLHQILG